MLAFLLFTITAFGAFLGLVMVVFCVGLLLQLDRESSAK